MTDFDLAFEFTMEQEVGPWFNPNDPDVIAGLCKTVAQKKKTGYVNHKSDRGGLTKFGLAQASHPQINIETMTLAQAKAIYFKAYWVAGRCNELPAPMSIAHFDACVNHGLSRGAKLLQQAIGAEPDGVIGPKTIALAKKVSAVISASDFLAPRRAFFRKIVENRPDQAVFLKGWMARCDNVEGMLK